MVRETIRSTFYCLLSTFYLLFSFCSCSGPGADLVLRGGRVYTLDPVHPWAEAIAIEGVTLVGVGPSADMDRHIGRDTVVVELDGRPVLPGFHDSHVHLMKGAVQLDWAILTEVDSRADALRIVKAHADANPDRLWILGAGWRVDDPHIIHRTDLDRVVSDRPVYLEANDGQSAWVNSKAMEIAGFDLEENETEGVLLGNDAVSLVRNALPRPSHQEQLQTLKRGVAHLHKFGITSIETEAGIEELELIEELEKHSDLELRILVVPTVESAADVDRLAKDHAARVLINGSVSILASELEQRGLRVIMEADSTDAVQVALRLLEKMDSARRHRLEGLEVVSKEDAPRLGDSGVTVAVPPLAASPDLKLRSDRLAWHSLVSLNVPLSFGSRWPEYDLDPLFGIYTVVMRQNLDGEPESGWVPEERLSVEEAVRAYTLNGVFASFGEDTRGSLEPGKLADVVVLTEDIFRIVPRRIVEVEAAMTIVGGRVVYVSPSFLPAEMRHLLTDGYN